MQFTTTPSPSLLSGAASAQQGSAGANGAAGINGLHGRTSGTVAGTAADGMAGRATGTAAVARMLQWPADGRTRPLVVRGQALLTVVQGQVWITRHGWPQDHWLRPGESLRVEAGSRWRRVRLYVSGEGENGITLKLEPIV